MGQRLELQALLIELLGSDNVYFQPPSNLVMKYPAIVYQRQNADVRYADNKVYKDLTRYQVTVIDSDPDSVIHKKLLDLPMCSYDRFFVADNLNHDVYNLYF